MECRKNASKFVTEGIAGGQCGISNYRGGVIVFATSVNSAQLSRDELVKKAKQMWESFVHDADGLIGAFSVGNAFKGKYKDIETREEFSEHSYTIEIGGLSSKGLLKLAGLVANEFAQRTTSTRTSSIS